MRPGFFLAMLAAAGCASVTPVRSGSVYRSGQLSAAQLEDTLKRNDIRTVVNLRGYQPTSKWYKDQTAVVDRLGVEQVDLEIGNAGPTDKQVAELMDVFQRAPKPILVHSYFSKGASGLASGMYRIGVEGERYETAKAELAPWQKPWLPLAPQKEHETFLAKWKPPAGSPGMVPDAASHQVAKAGRGGAEARIADLDRELSGNAAGTRGDESAPVVILGPPRPLSGVATREESARF